MAKATEQQKKEALEYLNRILPKSKDERKEILSLYKTRDAESNCKMNPSYGSFSHAVLVALSVASGLIPMCLFLNGKVDYSARKRQEIERFFNANKCNIVTKATKALDAYGQVRSRG